MIELTHIITSRHSASGAAANHVNHSLPHTGMLTSILSTRHWRCSTSSLRNAAQCRPCGGPSGREISSLNLSRSREAESCHWARRAQGPCRGRRPHHGIKRSSMRVISMSFICTQSLGSCSCSRSNTMHYAYAHAQRNITNCRAAGARSPSEVSGAKPACRCTVIPRLHSG